MLPSPSMATKFRDFIREVEEEAKAEGPLAVAELEAFRAHYRSRPSLRIRVATALAFGASAGLAMAVLGAACAHVLHGWPLPFVACAVGLVFGWYGSHRVLK